MCAAVFTCYEQKGDPRRRSHPFPVASGKRFSPCALAFSSFLADSLAATLFFESPLLVSSPPPPPPLRLFFPLSLLLDLKLTLYADNRDGVANKPADDFLSFFLIYSSSSRGRRLLLLSLTRVLASRVLGLNSNHGARLLRPRGLLRDRLRAVDAWPLCRQHAGLHGGLSDHHGACLAFPQDDVLY